MISPIQSPDHEASRPLVAHRLRAPLMGRSLPVLSTDVIDMMKINFDSVNSDDEESAHRNKRRYTMALLGRRGWTNSKRRGPLLG
jgi:hypothetical protein